MSSTKKIAVAMAVFASAMSLDAEARRDSAIEMSGFLSVLESTGHRVDPTVVRFGVGGDVEAYAVGAAAVSADVSTRIRFLESDLDFATGARHDEPGTVNGITPPDSPDLDDSAHAMLGIFDALAIGKARVGQDTADSIEQIVRASARLPGRAENRMRREDGESELRCLTEAVYYEARGESIEGQIAVAEVILNRVESKLFPNTVCGVIGQGSENLNACQFSYKCDGIPERMTNKAARKRAHDVAILLLKGERRDLTDRATHYHASYVSPSWSRKLEETAVFGKHIFYRRKLRTAMN